MGEVKCKRCDGAGVSGSVGDYFGTVRLKWCERCGGRGRVEEEKVGETISYSGGKVPEGDSLVWRARRWVGRVEAMPTEDWTRGYVLDGLNYVEDLCDALEERGREVERLRKQLELCVSASDAMGKMLGG